MIFISIFIVFGTLASIVFNIETDSPDLGLGAGLIIQGGTPWILLSLLWGGVALGVASLYRGRKWPKLGVLLVELPGVAFISWYVFVGSAFPAHALNIEVGSPFPAYALQDQDETLHELAALEKRPPALYIFYRGHW